MEIVIGLVIYAIIWAVVIKGSEFMNKNVQYSGVSRSPPVAAPACE